MPRPKPWLKMWVDWLGDPKMDSLSLAEQGAWWRLVSLAHQCAAEGALTVGGTPLSIEEIMKTLKISDMADRQVFLQMIDKMKTRESLHSNSNTLVVTHYQDRQTMMPSNLPDAVLARQHTHREKLKKTKEKREPEKRTPPYPTPDSIYTETEEEKCRDVTTLSRQKYHEKLVTAELSKLYEEYIGLLNPRDSDRIREFSERYGGEIEWIRKAFDAAGNHRSWPYVQAILERYQDEGGSDGKPRKEKPGAGSAADWGHSEKPASSEPFAATKRAGWKVKRSGPSKAASGEDIQ